MSFVNTPLASLDRKEVVAKMLQLESVDLVKYRKLSEEQTTSVSENLLTNMFNKLKGKFKQDKLQDQITASKGDITKIPNYKMLKESIQYLEKLAHNAKYRPEALVNVVTVHNYLVDNRKHFQKVFAIENRVCTYFYVNMVICLYHATAMTIAGCVEYVGNGRDYHTQLKEFDIKDLPSEEIGELAKACKSNKIDLMLQKSIADANGITHESFTLATIGAGVGIFMFAIWFIRDITYFFFKWRKDTSKWFESYATFLDMRNANLSRNNKGAAEKQANISKKFHEIADFLRVETQTVSKEVARSVQQMDKSNDALSHSEDDFVL